jgi:hypothetical protein
MGYEGGSQSKGTFIAPRAGTVQYCAIATAVATTGTNYITATLNKNGSTCSGPTMTLNGGSNVVVTDYTHTCTVAQGDKLSWALVWTGSLSTGGDVSWATCEY